MPFRAVNENFTAEGLKLKEIKTPNLAGMTHIHIYVYKGLALVYRTSPSLLV